MTTPLLEARELRIDLNGVPACEKLCFAAEGNHLVLLGRPAAAIAWCLGSRATIMTGDLLVANQRAIEAVRNGQLGLAPLDPPVPSGMNTSDYLALNLMLADFTARRASEVARNTLANLGLESLAQRTVESLAWPERRAAQIARAMTPLPAVLFVEAPIFSLEGPAAQYVLAALGRASQMCRLITTATRLDAPSAERELIMSADTIAILSHNTATWIGSPQDLLSDSRLFAMTLRGTVEPCIDQLKVLGFNLRGASHRWIVGAPEPLCVSEIFRTAEATGAIVVELVPISPESSPVRS